MNHLKRTLSLLVWGGLKAGDDLERSLSYAPQGNGPDDLRSNVAELAPVALGRLAQVFESLVGADTMASHQDALGLADHVPALQQRHEGGGWTARRS